ncbi:hypothetical protein GM661_03800 [Iocasia frigidifontis]|uniref:Fimbrial assembly protein n=1 Tax=Iocasia fonsfrigidae TaxID=2682810 RepID=A0A8A7K6Y8_9FIRM|nr:PilN domain-containing protein [Iocasia fonsfrigidae]QTL97161.1 hypothetical protein GM661_03800 [Iocasia fonsfrigidae]
MEFFKKYQTYILIDDSIIQLVQLKKGELIFNNVYDFNPLQNRISEYLEMLQKKTKTVKIIVPSTKLMIKTLELPPVSDNKINDILQFKFINELPYASNEIYYRYLRNSKSADKQGLAVAVSKKYITEITELCSKEGLAIKGLLPLSPLFYLDYHNKQGIEDSLYININCHYCYFTLIYNNDSYLKGCGYTGKIDLYDEIVRIYEYGQEEIGQKEISIVINGETVNFNDINKFLTGLDIASIDDNRLWKKFYSLEKRLISLDFYQLLPQVKQQKKRIKSISIGILLLLIFLVNGTTLYYKWQDKKNYIDYLATLETKQQTIVDEIEQLNEECQLIAVELEFYSNIIGENNYSYLPWLQEISNLLPEGTRVNSINFKDKELVLLAGKAKSAADVLAALESSSLFSQLHFIGSINLEEDLESFKIAGDLIYETNN